MAIAWSRRGGGGVIEAAKHVDVVAKLRQRSEARRHAVLAPFFGRNPIPLRNAVAIKPEDEARLDGLLGDFPGTGAGCSVGRAVRVEHRDQRWQPDDDVGAGSGQPLEQSAARQSNAFRDDLRHRRRLLLEILWRVLKILSVL